MWYLVVELVPDLEVVNAPHRSFSRHCGFESPSSEFAVIGPSSEKSELCSDARLYEVEGYLCEYVEMDLP